MRYALLAYGPADTWAALSDEERAAWVVDEVAFTAELSDRGAIVDAGGLADADVATTVRLRDGFVRLTDGPVSETDEQLGAFVIIDVPDLDTALEWAAKVPNVRTGSVEVRPVMPDAEAARADVTASAATG